MNGFREYSSYGALYTKSFGCSKAGFGDKFVRNPNKTTDSSQRPPQDCPKCGNLADGLYCRHCALLRKKFKEVWFTICDEHNFFQDFLNTSESSNDDSNVVNAPQEPIVFNQNPGEDSSQSHPQIDHQCCYRKFNRFSFFKTPKVLLLAWDRVFEIKNAFGNKQYKPKDVQELFRKLFDDVKNIHKELAEYINIPSWNRPAFSSHDDDDDEDYTIAITLEEPDNSLNIGGEHLDTISATESDEVVKSSVENLVSIPSESKGIPKNVYDVAFHDSSPPLDVSKEQFEEFSDSNDDSTSIDGDYFSIDTIDYIKASPPDSELVSLEGVEDDNLQEKLWNINLLIAKIKSLNENPTPDHVLSPPSRSPIPVEDNDSWRSLILLSLIRIILYPNSRLLAIVRKRQIVAVPLLMLITLFPKKNSGSTTIHPDISLPDLEYFNFNSKPDPGELTSIVDSEICKNVLSATNVNLPPEEDHSPLFAYVEQSKEYGTLEKEDYTVKMHMGRIKGAQGDCKAKVCHVSNDDVVVAQRRLEDKQLEEETNTDCLVQEQEKVQLGIKVGANITVTRVPDQEGAYGNVAKKKNVKESMEANLGKLFKYNAWSTRCPPIRSSRTRKRC
nr:zinc finger, CCHC-type [Tanacetum cinerariifolium]